LQIHVFPFWLSRLLSISLLVFSKSFSALQIIKRKQLLPNDNKVSFPFNSGGFFKDSMFEGKELKIKS
jgi:hypothetical protein